MGTCKITAVDDPLLDTHFFISIQSTYRAISVPAAEGTKTNST